MVYTLTLNPSLDYIMRVPNFLYGEVNRSSFERLYPGGKGVNVSVILGRLGVETKALGFKAGFIGDIFEQMLKANGVRCDFLPLSEGNTRINIKLKTGTETEINGKGIDISQKNIELLLLKLESLEENDLLVMAGAVPSTLASDIYGKITEKMALKGIKCIVDASGEALRESLCYRPFLIKPNLYELSELFGRKISVRNEIIRCALSLKESGAQNVLVSMSEEGALLIDETGKLHEVNAPKGVLINSTGAGDSMVAGFLAGLLLYRDYDKALKMGVAAGSASAFNEWLAEKKDIMGLYNTFRTS